MLDVEETTSFSGLRKGSQKRENEPGKGKGAIWKGQSGEREDKLQTEFSGRLWIWHLGPVAGAARSQERAPERFGLLGKVRTDHPRSQQRASSKPQIPGAGLILGTLGFRSLAGLPPQTELLAFLG